ncbi:uncharacterized protein LOC116853247 [Odontomachus brunneus]|uniref:uncharacterized protein LOC116853247 n=1 Tax=Odontomachus brunneus TaxID=486640 RepID=UPI0013F18609|nr:uncharacterized protein LOC116853247 [Odontomachus brunneus]
MGSSSSKGKEQVLVQEKKNISDTRRQVNIKSDANLEFNSNRNTRTAGYDCYLHNHVNNPPKVSCKPFNDSTKTATNKPRSKVPTNIPDVLSLKILTKDDFIPMWISWKNDFLTNMKLIDQAENNKEKWGIMLLNRLGLVGQDIYRTFTFDDSQANDDINVLLEKFDHYCMFGGKKRKHNEDIDAYVNNLKVIASKYTTNVDEIVKKKILEEIDVGKFTNNAKILIPGFSFPSSTMFLTIQEITHIWMRYENVSFKKDEKIVNYTVKNCSKCSLDHAINCCRAHGRQCTKCGNMNHHWSRCPSQYKENCSYCGESHFYRQCPAYMNECSKCCRLNHFYWMCGILKILNCNYCGLTHIASKSACSAVNTICVNCNKIGHVSGKCRKNTRTF